LYAAQRYTPSADEDDLDVELLDSEAEADSDDDDLGDEEAVLDIDDEEADEVEVEVTLSDERPPTVDDAYDDYVAGDFVSARAEAGRFTGSSDARVRQLALRIVGAASCFLGDRAGALRSSEDFDGKDRAFIRYVCGRNGVELP
jgi:hypothetical protein